MSLDFYDRSGAAVAYTNDGENIYLYSGEPVAYLSDGSVYSFAGQHLGWFEGGWLRDAAGHCVLFTADARGGPLKPLRQLRPLKGLRQLRPTKGVRQIKPLKPLKSLSWSDLSAEEFFR